MNNSVRVHEDIGYSAYVYAKTLKSYITNQGSMDYYGYYYEFFFADESDAIIFKLKFS
jgi:hypothetical protein